MNGKQVVELVRERLDPTDVASVLVEDGRIVVEASLHKVVAAVLEVLREAGFIDLERQPEDDRDEADR